MSDTERDRRIELAPGYSISRLIVGGWQFSGGHGAGASSEDDGLDLLGALVDMGLTTFDCADIYTGVEELFGRLVRQRRSASGDSGVQIHTKFVPDLGILPSIDRSYVEGIIHRSLRRLGVERLDLVQFHWWDFEVPGCVETAGWLDELRQAGDIRHLGLTNFDRSHLASVVDAGIPVVSNQVQYSVLDRRPAGELAPFCLDRGLALLCYGGLAGGFLTDGWLEREEAPAKLANRSLVKYRLIIDEMGGWDAYQGLMTTMSAIARRHRVSLLSVALRYVLDQPAVAATITGLDSLLQARETVRVLELRLDEEDREALDAALGHTRIPPGPVYGLERDREGPHGRIMRYNLNRG